MELNVTELVKRFADDGDLDPMDLSGSVMEHGLFAGEYTWNNCIELAGELIGNLLDTCTPLGKAILDNAQDVRDHFSEYGAWDEDEINGWSDRELVAITLQEIAASYRELESNDFIQDDTVSGRLYQGDIENDPSCGEWFLYLGL